MRVASICVSTIVSLKVFQNINELCRQILYCFQSKVVRDAVIGSRDPAGNGRDRVAVPTEGDPDAVLKGHGEKSVMLLSQHLSLTMEEILCIRYHMGAFVDQKEWNDYTRAVHMCPNILWTHTANMIAAHILEIDK